MRSMTRWGLVLGLFIGIAAGSRADDLNRPLPEVSFNDVSLEDSIQFLQDVSPDFKAMVSRDADAPADYPQVRVRLKNVTIPVFLDLLTQAYSGLEVSKVGGKDQMIYLIKVHASQGAKAGGGGAKNGLKVYRLSPAVGSVLAGKPDPGDDKARAAALKAALDQVLSLIKATMAQAGGGAGPLLQVHEETQTLIFKGSTDQRAALEDALTALGVSVPRSDDRVEAARKEVDEWRTRVDQERAAAAQQTHELQAALQEVRQQSRKLEAEAIERAVEVERLKVRLEEAQKQRAAAQDKEKGK